MTKLTLMQPAINKVIKENSKFLERRDMLREFIKLLPNISNPTAFFRDVDKQVGDDVDSLAPTVQRLLPVQLPFIIDVTLNTVTLAKLFKRTSFVKDPLFMTIAKHLSECRKEGEKGVVIFKVKNNGLFVAHDIPVHEKTTNAIVMVARQDNVDNLYIEPLQGFMYDMFGSDREYMED